MIGKGPSGLKGKMKGPTAGKRHTIERRSIVARQRVGGGRPVLPKHGRACPNRQLRGSKAKAPIAVVGNQHDLRVARGRRRRWLSAGGGRRLNNRRRCQCRSRACAARGIAPTGAEQHQRGCYQQTEPGGCAASWQARVLWPHVILFLATRTACSPVRGTGEQAAPF